jgi:hypothetical protein
LASQPDGAGEVADLPRIDHRDRDPGLRERRPEPALEPARGLDHDQQAALAGEPGDQPGDAAPVAAEPGLLTAWQQVHIEPAFAEIDANETLDLSETLPHDHPRMRACSPFDCSA